MLLFAVKSPLVIRRVNVELEVTLVIRGVCVPADRRVTKTCKTGKLIINSRGLSE
jgi:hypothetical protein